MLIGTWVFADAQLLIAFLYWLCDMSSSVVVMSCANIIILCLAQAEHHVM